MEKLRYILTVLALLSVGALFGGSLYDTLVLAPNLQGGPQGLEHGRLFMAAATPANFFRTLAPASQALVLAALVLNWRSPQVRWPLLIALAGLVTGDVVTFTYHYPRNAIMFTAPTTVEPERLGAVAREWQAANYLRVFLVLTAWLGAVRALTVIVQKRSTKIIDWDKVQELAAGLPIAGAPNGGPAMPPGDLGVTGGPPSVG